MWVESEASNYFNIVAVFPDSRYIRPALSALPCRSAKSCQSKATVITRHPTHLPSTIFWPEQESQTDAPADTESGSGCTIHHIFFSEFADAANADPLLARLSVELGPFNAQRIERQIGHGGAILWLKTRGADHARQIQKLMFQQGAYDVQLHTAPKAEAIDDLAAFRDLNHRAKAISPVRNARIRVRADSHLNVHFADQRNCH